MASIPANTKGIFILPKPSPGSATLPGSIILTDSTTVLDSAKRLALNGSPSTIVTPSSAKATANTSNTNDSHTKCKRKLNFSKLGLPDKHKSSPKCVEKRNARERNRVKTINGTFENLRDHLPCGDSVMQRKKQKKMSKVDILKGALDYISMLKQMLEETDLESMPSSPASPASQHASSYTATPSRTSHTVPSSPSGHLPASPCPTVSSYSASTPSVHTPGSPAGRPPSSPSTSSSYMPSSPHSYIPPSPATSSSYPSPHPSHQPPEEMSFVQRMKLESGSFLAALADPRPIRIPTSPGSTCSSSESVISSSPSPAPHLIPAQQQWDPDEEELKNFASWFQ